MPTPFNAELYLRLAGERAVLDAAADGNRSWNFPLGEVAAALIAIGVLPTETAQEVIEDYQLAVAVRVRGRQSGRFRPRRAAATGTVAPTVLTAPRVVACGREIEQSWGRLEIHYIVFGDRSTSLGVTAVDGATARRAPGRMAAHRMPLQQVRLTDDRGTTEFADFNGSGSPSVWQGRLTTSGPLSRRTRWISVNNERIELDEEPPELPRVVVEPLETASPAERYLRLRVAAGGGGPRPMPNDGLGDGIQALVAAGALAPNAAVISEVAAMAQGQTSRALPKQWASTLARRGASDGPTGALAVGVVTPPIDGVTVSIEALVTTSDGFEIHVETSPGIALGHHPMFHQASDQARIAWWAEDDRGNSYLGGGAGFSGSDQLTQATIAFYALDPRARELRLMPTGLTERAVVTLTVLPWARRR